MKDDIQNYSDSTFEDIKHINEYGQEFWYARELQIALGYGKWDNFKKVIDKAPKIPYLIILPTSGKRSPCQKEQRK